MYNYFIFCTIKLLILCVNLILLSFLFGVMLRTLTIMVIWSFGLGRDSGYSFLQNLLPATCLEACVYLLMNSPEDLPPPATSH